MRRPWQCSCPKERGTREETRSPAQEATNRLRTTNRRQGMYTLDEWGLRKSAIWILICISLRENSLPPVAANPYVLEVQSFASVPCLCGLMACLRQDLLSCVQHMIVSVLKSSNVCFLMLFVAAGGCQVSSKPQQHNECVETGDSPADDRQLDDY